MIHLYYTLICMKIKYINNILIKIKEIIAFALIRCILYIARNSATKLNTL